MRRYTILWMDLPAMERMFQNGYTHRQIAAALGFSKDQVKQALYRERRKARRLAEEGIIPRRQGRPYKWEKE